MLRAAAGQEHRSLANRVEVMIREYCGRNGIAVADQPPLEAGGTGVKMGQQKALRTKSKS